MFVKDANSISLLIITVTHEVVNVTLKKHANFTNYHCDLRPLLELMWHVVQSFSN